MRISDWSSDVCSSDLIDGDRLRNQEDERNPDEGGDLIEASQVNQGTNHRDHQQDGGDQQHKGEHRIGIRQDRKSVVTGKRVSVRVDIGGRSIINKKKINIKY